MLAYVQKKKPKNKNKTKRRRKKEQLHSHEVSVNWGRCVHAFKVSGYPQILEMFLSFSGRFHSNLSLAKTLITSLLSL